MAMGSWQGTAVSDGSMLIDSFLWIQVSLRDPANNSYWNSQIRWLYRECNILVCRQVRFRVDACGDSQERLLHWGIKWLQGDGGCAPQCRRFLKIWWCFWKRNVFWGFQKLVLTRSKYQKVPRKLAYAPGSRLYFLLFTPLLLHISCRPNLF